MPDTKPSASPAPKAEPVQTCYGEMGCTFARAACRQPTNPDQATVGRRVEPEMTRLAEPPRITSQETTR